MNIHYLSEFRTLPLDNSIKDRDRRGNVQWFVIAIAETGASKIATEMQWNSSYEQLLSSLD